MTLHIINKSPQQHHSLQDCLAVCTQGDAILLIESAVYAAVAASDYCQQLKQSGLPLYALYPDVLARGLSGLLDNQVQPISDNEFVQLTIEHSSTLSWY
jgi:tRNA 2-thiouridine synthesizing protein B